MVGKNGRKKTGKGDEGRSHNKAASSEVKGREDERKNERKRMARGGEKGKKEEE